MYTLCNEDIDRASDELTSILAGESISAQSSTPLRLAAEEILLEYRNHFGEGTPLELRQEKHFGMLRITLRLHCDRYNPISNNAEDELMLHRLMEMMGYTPVWSFRNGCNEIRFSVRAEGKLPDWADVAISAAIGIAAGIAARLLPAEWLLWLTGELLDPISSVIMGFLGAAAGLMVAMSIISSIVGMGSVSTLNRIGRSLIGRILLWMAFAAALTGVILPLIFPITDGAGTLFAFGDIWKMLLDVVPKNFLEPFLTGNTLQIVFLSLFVGFVTLRLAGKAEALVSAVQTLNLLTQEMIAVICKALPVVVFISLFELFSPGGMDVEFLQVYKYPLYFTAACLVWVAFKLIHLCVKRRIRLRVILKKLLPTFLISFSTASSAATLPTAMKLGEKKLGIDPMLLRIGLPLSFPLNRALTLIGRTLSVMCMAQMFHVEITQASLLPLLLTAFLLAIAEPAVPGGDVSSIALMFMRFGIPSEAMSVIIALDVLIDRILTSAELTDSQLVLIDTACALHEIDLETLRSDNI